MPRKVNKADDPWVLFAWAYYKDNHAMLLSACKKVIRSKRWRAAVSMEEAMGEVVDRLPDVIRCYDPKKGNLDAHVLINVKMYVYKLCRAVTIGPRKVRLGEIKIGALPEQLRARETESAASRVQKLLKHPDMPAIYAWLLEARYVEGMSLLDISRELKHNRASVKKWLEEALDAARCVADR